MFNFRKWANVPVDKGYDSCLPVTSGVYLFVDGRGVPVYVGQAKNLRKRHSDHHVITRLLVECGTYKNLTVVRNPTFTTGLKIYWDLCDEENLLHREAELFKWFSGVGGCELNIADPCDQLERRVTPVPSTVTENMAKLFERYLSLREAIKHNQEEADNLAESLKVALKNGLWCSPHYQGGKRIYVIQNSKGSTKVLNGEYPEYTNLQDRLVYLKASIAEVNRVIEALEKEYKLTGALTIFGGPISIGVK